MKQLIILIAVIFTLASCGKVASRNIYNTREGGQIVSSLHLHQGQAVKYNGGIYHITSMWSASPLNCKH